MSTEAAAPPPAAATRFARPFELALLISVVVFDQITKALVRQSIALGESRTIIDGFLDLTHVQNTGAAFGLLNSVDFPYKPWVMIGVATVALIAIAAYGTQLGFQDRLARIGLALILGGAFGNLLDRAMMGHVTDFVDIYWGSSHFWAFNVADAAINVGAALVILDMIGVGGQPARTSAAPASAPEGASARSRRSFSEGGSEPGERSGAPGAPASEPAGGPGGATPPDQ